ncbi:MAG: hypothetical protein PHV34_13110 [Verrucomicrobiae bacterium]|nr:hypothetical protein [Verrucomicrobiae bacterium]
MIRLILEDRLQVIPPVYHVVDCAGKFSPHLTRQFEERAACLFAIRSFISVNQFESKLGLPPFVDLRRKSAHFGKQRSREKFNFSFDE